MSCWHYLRLAIWMIVDWYALVVFVVLSGLDRYVRLSLQCSYFCEILL